MNPQLNSLIASIAAGVVGVLIGLGREWLTTHKTKKLQSIMSTLSGLATTAVHLYEDGESENSGKSKAEKYALAVSFIQGELKKHHITVSDEMVSGSIDVALAAMDKTWAQIEAAPVVEPAVSAAEHNEVTSESLSDSQKPASDSTSSVPVESVSTSESVSESASASTSKDDSFHWGGVAND